ERGIMNDEGISKSGGLLDVGVELGIITKAGSFFNYDGKVIAQGREGAKTYIKDNPKFAEELDKKIREKVSSSKKSLPTEIGETKEE
ncbi:DNA recombination/repair protein RecA, partial [Candidatus Microgenomates bacterium]|nr:DNA recombination/repair protein RecA [Candidatus Microgenomates bacterium]